MIQGGLKNLKRLKKFNNNSACNGRVIKKTMYIGKNMSNLWVSGSESEINKAICGYFDCAHRGVWVARAVEFVEGLTSILVYLRDRDGWQLTPMIYRENLELPAIEKLLFEYDARGANKDFIAASTGLKSYLLSIPDYTPPSQDEKGRSLSELSQKTIDQHGFIAMQLARAINQLAF